MALSIKKSDYYPRKHGVAIKGQDPMKLMKAVSKSEEASADSSGEKRQKGRLSASGIGPGITVAWQEGEKWTATRGNGSILNDEKKKTKPAQPNKNKGGTYS